MTLEPAQIVAAAVAGLLGVGLYGLLAAHKLIKVIIALQILVKGAILALVAAGYATGQMHLGQSLAVTVIVADTVVAVVGLALAVQVKRRFGTLDVEALSELKR
jgi:NADH:ubiquinone oxidoreductase subunit K